MEPSFRRFFTAARAVRTSAAFARAAARCSGVRPSLVGLGFLAVGGAAAGLAANYQAWKFDITHANQAEFLAYPAGGRYQAHVDTFIQHGDECRKLTVLAFLNDDFKGGKFYLQNGYEKYYPPQSKGTVLVFPSFIMHGVEDVEEGNRYSVVCWMVGKFFK
jgi:PKHD-type hydroxylase